MIANIVKGKKMNKMSLGLMSAMNTEKKDNPNKTKNIFLIGVETIESFERMDVIKRGRVMMHMAMM